MGPVSKRKKANLANLNVGNKINERLKDWNDKLSSFDDAKLANTMGRVQSTEENKIILSSLKMLLSKELELLHYKRKSIMKLSWTKLETQLAGHLHVKQAHITALRKAFLDNGEIATFGNNKNRGQASAAYKKSPLLDKFQLCNLLNEVDIK